MLSPYNFHVLIEFISKRTKKKKKKTKKDAYPDKIGGGGKSFSRCRRILRTSTRTRTRTRGTAMASLCLMSLLWGKLDLTVSEDFTLNHTEVGTAAANATTHTAKMRKLVHAPI